jgi:3-hydroxyisobutyrate dehydrogenase/putative dehydrogenase
MHLVIGLVAIGGNIGARLAELGRGGDGYDLNPDRVREWSAETKSQAGSDLAAIDWPSVDSVHLAVRYIDDDVEQSILQARALLRSNSANE